MSECSYEKGGSKKYVLLESYVDWLHFGYTHDLDVGYCILLRTGALYITRGYEWDGPSGPAIDTDNFMDGSLVHDVLYQMLREGWFGDGFWERAKWRLRADNEMFKQCKKDKMTLPRRCWTWLGVRLGGYWSAN